MSPKRAFNEPSKSDKKVLSIALAAARLFSSKGYAETSGEDIAAAAKISKSAMYYYFKSKTDVLDFVLTSFMDTVLLGLEQDLEAEDPAEKLRLFIFRHIRIYSENTYLAKTLLNEAHNLPPAKLRKIEAQQRQYFTAVSAAISAYSEGKIDKDRLTVLTFNLLGMCNWNYAWYDPKGAITPEELSQIIFEIFTGTFWKKLRPLAAGIT